MSVHVQSSRRLVPVLSLVATLFVALESGPALAQG